MKIHHILDKQPKYGQVIVQIDAPYEFYEGDFKMRYNIGMREWNMLCTWQEYLEFCDKNGIKDNFWWIAAEEFPWPQERKENVNGE